MKVIKKIVSVFMMMLIIVQISGATIYNAAEIVKLSEIVSEDISEVNSEDISETKEAASGVEEPLNSEVSEIKEEVSAANSEDTITYSLTDVDISNSLFNGKMSYKPASNSGLYTVTMNSVNEIAPDNIQGGETITMSLVDPVDAPNTCTNPDVSPVITPNSEYTKPFENTLTGELITDYSADGTSITFTFNDANLGFLLNLGQAVFAWDIDIDDSLRGIDFPCGINTVITDTDGTELINNTQEVVFDEPVAVINYVPVDWSLNDTYAKRGNIITPGNSVANRQDLNSAGYYEGLGVEEPKGGIIDNGAHYVGNAITLNLTKGTYSVLNDVNEMRATFTVPQETTLMEDTVHIAARPYIGSTVEVTSLLHPNFLTYDDSTKTATFTMTAEDFANIESELGIDMSDPTITIYFEEKISKYTVKPQYDNYIYGSASVFDTDSWAAEVDALDGYPNEGRVEVEYIDYNDSVVEGSTRLAYQEIDDSSGVVRDPRDPTLVGTVTDDNEIDVESNKNSVCTPTQVYNFSYNLYNNYVFHQTMGEITITLPDQVNFDIDNVTIKLNGVEVAHDNAYFTVAQDGNTIIITGTEYDEDNIFEMDYGVIDVSIPVTLVDVNVGDSLLANSSWELFGETYNTNDLTTSIFDCDITDPVQGDTVIDKSFVDASGDGVVQPGEILTYTLDVSNPNLIDANNVEVRDSMLEAMPTWITFNDDVVVKDQDGNELTLDTDYTGDLQTGDFAIIKIPANSTFTITYSVRVNAIPEGVETISNTATDNGQDPIDPDTNLPLVCGPTTKETANANETDLNVSASVEQEEKSNPITNFFSNLREGESWNSVLTNPEISTATDLNNTLDMYSNQGVSDAVDTEYSSDNWVPFGTEPYMQLDHMGEDVIGEYIRYNNVDFGGTFSFGSAVDIKITISDAVVGETSVDDNQYITFSNRIGGINQGGYSRVDFTVEFLESGTDIPVVVSPLVRFSDIDYSQVLGTQTDSTYIVSADSELEYADNTDGTYFSFDGDSLGDDQKHWVLIDFGDVSSFTFTYGMNKMATDPMVPIASGYTNLDIRLRGSAGQIELNKADEDGNPLAGAEFTIYDSANVEKGTMTTNEDGYAISNALLLGDYTVVETKAPDGYVI